MRQFKKTKMMVSFLILYLFTFCINATNLHAADSNPLTAFNNGPAALEFEHFPSRMHTFIWRNWSVTPAERLAEVLGTSAENVNRVAATMGLTPQKDVSPLWKSSQGYITVLRRNWHLLPYPQILQLLDVSAEELAESLQEDDFLFIKLGSLKPQCEPLRFTEPTEEQKRRCEQIAKNIRDTLGEKWNAPGENRFKFLNEFFTTDSTLESPIPNPQSLPFRVAIFVLVFCDVRRSVA